MSMTVLEYVVMLRNSLSYLYLLNYFFSLLSAFAPSPTEVFTISFHITLAHASWSLPCEPWSYPLSRESVTFAENTCFCGIFILFWFPPLMLSLKSSPPSRILQLEIALSFPHSFLYFMYLLGYLHSHLFRVGSAQILKYTKKKAALDNLI